MKSHIHDTILEIKSTVSFTLEDLQDFYLFFYFFCKRERETKRHTYKFTEKKICELAKAELCMEFKIGVWRAMYLAGGRVAEEQQLTLQIN